MRQVINAPILIVVYISHVAIKEGQQSFIYSNGLETFNFTAGNTISP